MASETSARRLRIRALFLIAVALVFAVLMIDAGQGRAPISSAETRFTETSEGGMQIVPASCNSYPHYSGDCSGNSIPPVPNAGCVLVATPEAITIGQGTTLGWNTACGPLGCLLQPAPGGVITPGVGNIPASGTQTIFPGQTTTYIYTGNYLLGNQFSCARSVTVCAAGQAVQNGVCVSQCPSGTVLDTSTGQCMNYCPAGYHRIGNDCVPNSCAGYYCSGNDLYSAQMTGAGATGSQCTSSLVQHCAFGCAGSACIAAPAPLASITASPSLLKSGETSVVSWTSTNTSSCTVTAPNGDSWSGTSGSETTKPITSQTAYTLTCTGLDDSTLVKKATINIIPNFQEVQCPAGYTVVNGSCVAN